MTFLWDILKYYCISLIFYVLFIHHENTDISAGALQKFEILQHVRIFLKDLKLYKYEKKILCDHNAK